MSNTRKIILAVIGISIVISCFFYIDYRIIKVHARNALEFEKRIMAEMKVRDTIDLRNMTPFQWDKLYYFHEYTPPKHMYEKTGARWTNNNTFIGYLIFNDIEKEIVQDGFYALVFLYKGKVVCHYVGASDKFDFDIETQEDIKAEDSLFRVSYKELGYNNKYPLLKKQKTSHG